MGTDGTAIGRLKQLDGVRGLAACAVAFGYHSKILFERAVFEDGWGGPVAAWLRDNGWTAVDLFFLLSGFVFAHVYRFGESLQSTRALADFTVARIARLYPLHLFMLVCCAATFWWM
ncbi:MAG TPA: acyltransferase family protein, partial [Sphingopyxis terrae]|nr:acyltransferase family protein [Sphingopyxis terrae]